jgi:hypothetical protein
MLRFNQSLLKQAVFHDLEYCLYQYYNKPDYDTPAMRVGRMVDELYIGGSDTAHLWQEAQDKEKNTYNRKTEHPYYLPASKYETALRCVDSLRLHLPDDFVQKKEVQKMHERDTGKGYAFYGTPDLVDHDNNIIYDLKTIADVDEAYKVLQYNRYGYMHQAAMYLYLLDWWEQGTFRWIFVEKQAPYRVKSFQVADNAGYNDLTRELEDLFEIADNIVRTVKKYDTFEEYKKAEIKKNPLRPTELFLSPYSCRPNFVVQ